MKTPAPMALAVLMLSMTPAEQVLVTGTLADALAYAAGASSPVVADVGSDSIATVRPVAP